MTTAQISMMTEKGPVNWRAAKCSAREEKLFRSSPGNFGLPCAFPSPNKVVDELEFTVKVLPFVFALVPLVAVVSACVSTY